MKIHSQRAMPRRLAARAFTLAELLIVAVVGLFVVAGVFGMSLFGLKLYNMIQVKLQASSDARRALNDLVTEIHSAGIVEVGTNTTSWGFTQCSFNTTQKGDAIMIFPVKTNTNNYVLYYMDTDNELKRLNSGTGQTPTVISAWVTNALVFTSEDYQGNVMTNNFNNRVIGIDLEFFRLANPMIQFGTGQYFDHYRLVTRVTRRALE